MAYVQKTAIKEKARKEGVSVSADVFEQLETEVETLIDRAIQRTNANNRKTLSARDF